MSVLSNELAGALRVYGDAAMQIPADACKHYVVLSVYATIWYEDPWNRSGQLLGSMSTAAKTDAIVVWDIENTRVPTQLIPRCFEIVQWLLQDVQTNCPNSTVCRVFVAGTFDNYPSLLKNALCTHPRVQLLYSIGKVIFHLICLHTYTDSVLGCMSSQTQFANR